MAGASSFHVNPETGLPDIHDFAEFGQALRSMSADDETQHLTAGMGELSVAIEGVGKALARHERGAMVGPLLVDLLTALRKHRQQIGGLSASWQSMYEYRAYTAALNNFRILIGQWLVERKISGDVEVVIDDFEMIGWRSLGEGLLMIDFHEQWRMQALNAQSAGSKTALARAKNWWGQLRGKDRLSASAQR